MHRPARPAGQPFLCRFLPSEVESGGPLIDNAKVACRFRKVGKTGRNRLPSKQIPVGRIGK